MDLREFPHIGNGNGNLPPISPTTYARDWSAYNESQTQEKALFTLLLHGLCEPLPALPQEAGRPRLPLADMVFAATYKSYSTFSGRRFMTDLREACASGYISRAPHFNSIFNYLELPELTPILHGLITESALPLKTIETDFAIDSSGFTTSVAAGATFKNLNGDALSTDRINVMGNVSLRNGFSAQGRVRLVGAEIMGQLAVIDACLDGLTLESAHITGPFFWRTIRKDPHPDFPNKDWNPFLDLTNAKVGPLADEAASWPGKGRLRLNGFVYDSITAGPTDATARLRWLNLQPNDDGYLPQPYEQLIAVLRQMGHEHQVAKVAIAKQKDLRKRGHLGLLGWIRSWFLYLAVGYGYRAWLAFIWLFLLIAVGSHVFSRAHNANVLVPADQAAYEKYENPKNRELPVTYPRFHALLYSLDVVSPFDLGQKSHWRLIESTSYWKFEFYSLFQLFAGWALLIVAAAIPAGFIKKD